MQVFLPPEHITLKDMTEFRDAKNQINFNAYDAACKVFIQEVKDFCKKNSKCPDAGEELNFPMGDGYAQYILLDYRQMVFLNVMDAYQISDAHARGLRKADVVNLILADRAMAEHFAKHSSTA